MITLYHVCTLQPCAPLTIIMPWLEWCPDPQRPDAQWVKIFHPGSWTPQDERDDPPPRHTYREWKEFYAPNHAQDGDQPSSSAWYKRDWTTEGYRRVAAPEPDHGFNLLVNITWPRNHRFFDLRMLRLSLLRISLVFKQGSVRSCRIARVKRPTSTNRYVLLGALSHLSLLGSLIHIYLQANHAALPTRRSLSSS